MSGFGTAPFGAAPYGSGTPAVAPEVGGEPLNDETQISQGCAFIDPITRTYVFDANGRRKGMASVPQLVQLVIATRLNSSAVRGLGIDFDIEDAGSQLDPQIRTRVESAFADLVRQKLVKILSVTIEPFSNAGGEVGAKIRIRWQDLTTGREEAVSL